MSPRAARPARTAGLGAAAPVFAALGDETRIEIVALLCAGGPMSIARLTEGTHVTRQAVTTHLQVLARAGLARGTRSGRDHVWEIAARRLDDARRNRSDRAALGGGARPPQGVARGLVIGVRNGVRRNAYTIEHRIVVSNPSRRGGGMSAKRTWVLAVLAVCATVSVGLLVASGSPDPDAVLVHIQLWKTGTKSGTNTLAIPYIRPTGLNSAFNLLQDIDGGGPPFTKVFSVARLPQPSSLHGWHGLASGTFRSSPVRGIESRCGTTSCTRSS
jgi:DNA-binding transcriptional ArsR family regulator